MPPHNGHKQITEMKQKTNSAKRTAQQGTTRKDVITHIERKDVLTRLAHKDILTLISFCVVILPCIIMISENLPSALCGAVYWAFLAVFFSTDRGHRYMKNVEKSYYNLFKDDERE